MPSLRSRFRKNEAAALSELPPLPGAQRGLPVDPSSGAADRSSIGGSSIREMSAPAPSRAVRFVSSAASAVRRVIPSVGRRSQSTGRLAPLDEAPGSLARLAPLGKAGSTPKFDLRPACPWSQDDRKPCFVVKPLAQDAFICGRDLRPSLPWAVSTSAKNKSANISDKPLKPDALSPTSSSRGSGSNAPSPALQAVELPSSLNTDSERTSPQSASAKDARVSGELAVDVTALANGDQACAGISDPYPLSARSIIGEVAKCDSSSIPSSLDDRLALDTEALAPAGSVEASAANSPCCLHTLEELDSAAVDAESVTKDVCLSPASSDVAERIQAMLASSTKSEQQAAPITASFDDDVLVPNLPASAADAFAKDALKCKVQAEFLEQRDLGVSPISATVAALHLCADKSRSTSVTNKACVRSAKLPVATPLEAISAPPADSSSEKASSSTASSKEAMPTPKLAESEATTIAKDALRCKVQEEFLVQCDLGATPTSATIIALHRCTKILRSEASAVSLKKLDEPTVGRHAHSDNTLEELMSPKKHGAVKAC